MSKPAKNEALLHAGPGGLDLTVSAGEATKAFTFDDDPEPGSFEDQVEELVGNEDDDSDEDEDDDDDEVDEESEDDADDEEDEDEDESADDDDDDEDGADDEDDEDLDDEEKSFKQRYGATRQKLAEERRQREEANQQLALVQQQVAQLQGYMQHQHQQAVIAAQQANVQPVTQEQIDQAVANGPVDTFKWAVDNRPDLVPAIIDSMAQNPHENPRLGQGAAMQAHAAWMQHQQQGMLAQQQAMMQQAQAPQMIERGLELVVANVAQTLEARGYGKEFQELIPRIDELCEQNIHELEEVSPHALKEFVQSQFLVALKERQESSNTKKAKKGRKLKPEDHVEVGNTSRTPKSKRKAPGEESAEDIMGGMKAAYDKSQYK